MTFMIIPKNGSVLDRERACDRCKQRAAAVIFDRALVCAACAYALSKALVKEKKEHGAQARAAEQ